MRMLIYLWIGQTLVLGICGDVVAKRAAEDIQGSGDNFSGGGGLNLDDEDYSSYSSYESANSVGSEYESSGSSSSYESESSITPSEDNSIKFRGEFTINGIGGGTLDWMEDLSNPRSETYTEFSNIILPMIRQALESKRATRKGLQNISILAFRHGSIITEYEASYSPESTITADEVRRSLKDAISTKNFGTLEVDPKSVSLVTAIRPASVIITDGPIPTTKRAKTTVISTTSITTSVSTNEQTERSHKTDPPMVPTTQSNAINDKTESNGKPKNPDLGNEVDPITIDDTIDDGIVAEPEPTNEVGNTLDRDGDPEAETQNFWDKLFSHPLILAGLVGAVVIALLTVVLLLMFIVYRLKKKDEGSYSLDEPHKVKDPMAYWKDTKEFYA
ncbi:uncharacterized protein [Amphiura filiformis]|uniref:uncharacterized protein isoform X2 n=1 Tax=Amphiura filiformis TaxID=82378 RepID=UPI003B2107B2